MDSINPLDIGFIYHLVELVTHYYLTNELKYIWYNGY